MSELEACRAAGLDADWVSRGGGREEEEEEEMRWRGCDNDRLKFGVSCVCGRGGEGVCVCLGGWRE